MGRNTPVETAPSTVPADHGNRQCVAIKSTAKDNTCPSRSLKPLNSVGPARSGFKGGSVAPQLSDRAANLSAVAMKRHRPFGALYPLTGLLGPTRCGFPCAIEWTTGNADAGANHRRREKH